MTGSEADTEQPGDEEDPVDSRKLARFLTPVPQPRSSFPPRPSNAPESVEGGDAKPPTLFSDRPVPRRNSSLLPPPGDAVPEAPAAPPPIDPESPTASVAVDRISFDDAMDDVPADEPELDFVVSRGGLLADARRLLGDPRRRRIAIGAAAAAVIFCLFLAARRKAPSPTAGAPNAASSSASALPSINPEHQDEPLDPNEDPSVELGEVNLDKARDLRREARQVLEAGHAEEGVRLARSAIQSDPNDPEGYILLAAGLQDLGHWQESRDVFAKCVRQSNGKASAECVYFATKSK